MTTGHPGPHYEIGCPGCHEGLDGASSGTCDWGDCDEIAVTTRYSEPADEWLQVCRGHRSDCDHWWQHWREHETGEVTVACELCGNEWTEDDETPNSTRRSNSMSTQTEDTATYADPEAGIQYALKPQNVGNTFDPPRGSDWFPCPLCPRAMANRRYQGFMGRYDALRRHLSDQHNARVTDQRFTITVGRTFDDEGQVVRYAQPNDS